MDQERSRKIGVVAGRVFKHALALFVLSNWVIITGDVGQTLTGKFDAVSTYDATNVSV